MGDFLIKDSLPSELTGTTEPTVARSTWDYISLRYLESVLGVDLGDLIVTILTVILIFSVTHLVAKLIEWYWKRRKSKEADDEGKDDERETPIKKLLLAFIYLAGVFLAIISLSGSVVERALGIRIWSIVGTIATITVILLVTWYLARLVDKFLERYRPKVTVTRGVEVGFDRTFHTLVRRFLVAFVYMLGVLTVILLIQPLHTMAVALLAGAGLAGVAVGFAAQESLSNIISGVFLAVFKPIQIGDYVDFNGEYGHIEDLTLRHTVICTWDLKRIVVPNSVMGRENIINWSIKNPEVTWPVDFGIAYDADIDKARALILEEARKNPHVLKDRDIDVRVTELGDFAVNLRLTFNVKHRDLASTTGCSIREAVKKRFDAEGIEIPFPYYNVVLKGSSKKPPQNFAS
jgi:small-conductance mechanosensitive channel